MCMSRSIDPKDEFRHTVMPWGKYHGLPLTDLPLEYMKWLYQQDWLPLGLAADLAHARAVQKRHERSTTDV